MHRILNVTGAERETDHGGCHSQYPPGQAPLTWAGALSPKDVCSNQVQSMPTPQVAHPEEVGQAGDFPPVLQVPT